MSEDVNTTLYKILAKYLTKKETEKLESLISEHGSILDVVLFAVRKVINPDLLTYADLEACIQKAIKINAYVSMISNSPIYPSDISNPYQVAREVVQGLNSQQVQQENNPFAEMINMFKQQLMNQLMEEIRLRLNIPIKPTDNTNSPVIGNDNSNTNANNKDEIFMGDIDEEEE